MARSILMVLSCSLARSLSVVLSLALAKFYGHAQDEQSGKAAAVSDDATKCSLARDSEQGTI